MKKIIFVISLFFLMGIGLTGCSSKENNSNEYDYFMQNYKYLDDKENVFESLTYGELLGFLDSEGTYIIYFGGSWCPNCQAAVPFINEVAKKEKIIKVYNFDTRLDHKSSKLDIRKANDEAQTLMWETIIRKLGFDSGNVVKVDDKPVLGSDGMTISTMPVPTVLAIKNGKMLGSITREYIYDEMTEEDMNDYRNELRKVFDLIK